MVNVVEDSIVIPVQATGILLSMRIPMMRVTAFFTWLILFLMIPGFLLFCWIQSELLLLELRTIQQTAIAQLKMYLILVSLRLVVIGWIAGRHLGGGGIRAKHQME